MESLLENYAFNMKSDGGQCYKCCWLAASAAHVSGRKTGIMLKF